MGGRHEWERDGGLPAGGVVSGSGGPDAAAAVERRRLGGSASGAGRIDAPTGTVWVWLIVLLPLVNLPLLFVLDVPGYMRAILDAGISGDRQAIGGILFAYLPPALLISLTGLLANALTVMFAWLDWRALRRRGIPDPFLWVWVLLGLAIYVIGRGVVLRRRTGHGLGPVWVVIAVEVVALVVVSVWSSMLVSGMAQVFLSYAQTIAR
jgi:hypothetical protein